MNHLFENVSSLGDLAERIRNWTSFKDEDIYDYGGLIHILAACLGNLRKHSIPVDLEELADHLSDEEIETLIKLAKAVQKDPGDG
jgi:hypothetical protein